MAKQNDKIKAQKMARAAAITPAIRAMNGDAAYEMKEAYYKAAEGLTALRESLEALRVVAPVGAERDAVTLDLLFISRAEQEFDKSCLGRIL